MLSAMAQCTVNRSEQALYESQVVLPDLLWEESDHMKLETLEVMN